MNKRKPYVEILSDSWREHLKQKANSAPTVISTFAGMGGSSLGYSMGGFAERLAVEWDDHSVEQFRRNFPQVDVYHGDIAQLTVDETLERSGLRPGELDVFDGSPPCQGFSIAGKGDPDDPRNQLFREYIRLLRGLQPKVFVMENVANMTSPRMMPVFKDIVSELSDAGYKVKVRVIEAKYYFVPQMRKRCILMGVRNDLEVEPVFPKRQSSPISCVEALRDLYIPQDEKVWLDMSSKLSRSWGMIKQGHGANEVFWYGTQTSASCRKPNPLRPCNTITKTGGSPCGFGGLLHWDEPRLLSVPEAKRLMSIPDEYILNGSYEQRWARIGNGVPPLMMRAIAKTIRTEILDKLSENK